MVDFCDEKVYVRLRFIFEAYAKKYKRRLSALQKLLTFYWMVMNMYLPKFDIYHNSNKHKLLITWLFPKNKFLFDLLPKIHFVWGNIVFTRQGSQHIYIGVL